MKRIITLLAIQFSVFLASCHAENSINSFEEGHLELVNGENIKIAIVYSENDQKRGLSGIRSIDFPRNKGMLFYYLDDDYRRFWMPDTYFNLDIYFIDKNFKVLAIERNIDAHPGMITPPEIKKTRTIFCRHVLELRADDPISKKIKIGDVLKWKNTYTIKEFEKNIKSKNID